MFCCSDASNSHAGLPVVLPAEEESVLLGAGILAGAAAHNQEVFPFDSTSVEL